MLKYGDYEIDETRFPPAITQRLLSRAVAHILGNEVASSVLAWEKRQIAEARQIKADAVTDAMLQEFRADPSSVAKTDEKENELRMAKIAAMLDGTLAVRISRGPTRDPVEAAARAIAKAEVVAVLKHNGAKFPGKDETLSVPGTDANGQPTSTEVDGDTLIDRRLEKHGDRIRKLADRKVADERRLREATAKTVAGEAGGLAESLGL